MFHLAKPSKTQDVGQHAVPHDGPEELNRHIRLIVDQPVAEKDQ